MEQLAGPASVYTYQRSVAWLTTGLATACGGSSAAFLARMMLGGGLGLATRGARGALAIAARLAADGCPSSGILLPGAGGPSDGARLGGDGAGGSSAGEIDAGNIVSGTTFRSTDGGGGAGAATGAGGATTMVGGLSARANNMITLAVATTMLRPARTKVSRK